jgi:hypothetical protein
MIMFRRFSYAVTLRTRLEYSEQLHRSVWKKTGSPYTVWRQHGPIHVLLVEGEDSGGIRWASICGRRYHGPYDKAAFDMERISFEADLRPCLICAAWYKKHRDEIIVAERIE